MSAVTSSNLALALNQNLRFLSHKRPSKILDSDLLSAWTKPPVPFQSSSLIDLQATFRPAKSHSFARAEICSIHINFMLVSFFASRPPGVEHLEARTFRLCSGSLETTLSFRPLPLGSPVVPPLSYLVA